MSADPVRHLLALQRLGVGEVRGAQRGHEQLHLVHLSGGGIDPVGLLAGEVAEEFLAGAVHLAHHQRLLLLPAPVMIAELGVAVALGVALAVLDVEELQGHPRLLQLQVHPPGIGQRRFDLTARRPVDRLLQLRLTERLNPLPLKSQLGGPLRHLAHLAHAHAERAGNVPVAAPLEPLEP